MQYKWEQVKWWDRILQVHSQCIKAKLLYLEHHQTQASFEDHLEESTNSSWVTIFGVNIHYIYLCVERGWLARVILWKPNNFEAKLGDQ